MNRRLSLFLAVVAIVSGAVLMQACAASGGASDDSTATGGDATTGGGDSQTTDGSPVSTDSSPPTDSGSDGGGSTCVLTPPSDKCGIFPNCGCAGTTCDFFFDSGTTIDPTACTSSVGVAAGGAPCTQTTDCAEGLTCTLGRCHEFCGTEGTPCTGVFSDCRNRAGIAGFNICGIKCDLTDAGSCGGGGFGCLPVPAGGGATTECEAVGTGVVGDTCAVPADCAASLNCVTTSGNHCQKVCAPAGTTGGCTTGTCNSFSSPITIDGVTYGYCG